MHPTILAFMRSNEWQQTREEPDTCNTFAAQGTRPELMTEQRTIDRKQTIDEWHIPKSFLNTTELDSYQTVTHLLQSDVRHCQSLPNLTDCDLSVTRPFQNVSTAQPETKHYRTPDARQQTDVTYPLMALLATKLGAWLPTRYFDTNQTVSNYVY